MGYIVKRYINNRSVEEQELSTIRITHPVVMNTVGEAIAKNNQRYREA